jgi:DNA recombination protein RmuC
MLLALVSLTLLVALASAVMSALALRGRDDGGADARMREEFRALTRELHDAFARQTGVHETRFEGFTRTVNEGLKTSTDGFAHTQTTRLSETNQQMKALAEAQKAGLEGVAGKIEALTAANAERQEKLRETLAASLEQLRKENEAKLEQMRATVDEKLQGALEQRLGESFKIVSERLEAVHKGLGEMQTLATGVGDLKRVLTNVKSRGGWGEVQLGMLLEDMLTADQYASNVAVQPGASERVEFAVRLPGKGGRGAGGSGDDAPVWLPIDAKFPHEDYDRLLAAQDIGVAEDVERAGLALERAVRLQAKMICAKYVCPPHSTDFAIMYLPTEGLFAEVIRRPGLMVELQSTQRVMITGPTTLAAILNSLQMGFRTIAIEKRSSEVWQVLGEAKAEFGKYAAFIDKVSRQLATAQNTLEDASKRTRAVERKLRKVETAEGIEGGGELLALPGLEDEEEAA